MRVVPTLYALIAVPVYLAANRFISPHINHNKFKSLIFAIVLVYGVLLIKQDLMA